MPLRKSKSDVPTGRYEDEVKRTQRTLWLLDDSYGFHFVKIFTYGGEVKNTSVTIQIQHTDRKICS